MELGISGKAALVTGASKGLGRAVASALVAEGARVAVTSRSRERIEASAREIGAHPFVHDSADLDGVTLNTLLTGRIRTERTLDMSASIEEAEAQARELVPVGRLGTPEEFAAVAAFLCSEPASYVTGAAIPVDGGLLRGV